ncbi:MAG: insulinase family protein [Deltaproteobacteria bacterium]|nr:insulinase family protein [Deltaproteobacteria bacterium]
MIHRVRLDNGIRLLVRPTSAAPLAAIYLWMETGSVDEQPGEEGAAHYLEHMLFKGTARRGLGVAAAEIEGLGGDLNAYTSNEQTVLYATVEASAWAQALDVLVDMMRNNLLDPAEFVREKQVVLEEIRSYLDEPESVVAEATLARVYPGHAYGRPILGTLRSIRALTRTRLHRFWKRCYHPERLIVSVAGAVEPARVESAVQDLLGDWEPGAGDRVIPPAPQGAPTVHRVAGAFESTAVEIAWPTPPLGHPDIPALDILSAALGDGVAAVFPMRLQIRDGLASEIGTSLSARTAGGDLALGFLPREGQTAAAITAALEEATTVALRGLDGAQVSRARDACLADFLFGAETVDGIAHDAAWYTAKMGDPDAREAYRASIAAVTTQQVRHVARTWLSPDRCIVVALDRHLPRPELEQCVLDRRVHSAPLVPSFQPIRTVFANGATLWVLPDDTPVAALRVAGLGGGLAVDARRAGLHIMWARAVSAGADDLPAHKFAEAVDRIAGILEGSAGRNTLGLAATFPAEHITEGLALVGKALTAPRFDANEVDRIRDELVEEVRTRNDRPGQLASELLWSRLWPAHPWRLPPTGTEASLQYVGRKTLRRWHQGLITGDNMVVAVSGGVDPDGVREAIQPWLEALPPGPFALGDRGAPQAPGRGVIRRRAGREQSWVLRGVRGVSVADPARLPLLVAAAILGSQGGRLFLSLREDRGLAYSVWARSMNGWDGGVLVAGLATEPKRVREARRALREELERLTAEPPTEEEFERCRRMLIGGAAMNLQRVAGRANEVALAERLGIPWGLEAFRAALGEVTLEAVRDEVGRALAAEAVEVLVEPDR